MNPYSCHSCAKPSSSTMLDRFQLGFSPDIKLLPPHHNACHFVGSTEMDILRRFANIANFLLLLLTIYAWPRPDPALDTFKTSRPANPKIQSNKSKTFFIEILSVTTTSAERIEGSFGRNPSQVRLEISAASGWRDTGVAEKSFSAGWLRCCCYFPPIRPLTVKP